MEHVKRFIFILFLFISSLIFIHGTRNTPKGASEEIHIACLPAPIAQQLEADSHLKKWNDQMIVYNTEEKDKTTPSYRCYISLPTNDIVCTPQEVANRKDLQKCPAFPALWSSDRTCYFLNTKHHDFHKKLSSPQRISIGDLPGTPVTTIEEAKKVLKGIR